MALIHYDLGSLSTEAAADSLYTIDWLRFLDRPLFAGSDWDSSIAGKTVLVTGAAGSIGSAVSLLLMSSSAARIILLDCSERNMRELHQRSKKQDFIRPKIEFVHADILCRQRLQEIFSEHEPDIIFHSAALKHLPELESNPFAALENNTLGTINLLQMLDCFPVECFVNVSTDKAVNPTSILGVSKRLTELFLMTAQSSSPRRISLRLGNVLGSSGSVVPHFIQSLRSREPLQITDPLASRYFLTMEETAAMVMQSSVFSTSLLLLPEMGRPRNIIELAAFLLNEFELEKDNLHVTFMGLKDGEKRSEEITYSYEHLRETVTPGLYEICGNNISDPERFAAGLDRLLVLVAHRSNEGLMDCLVNLVPEFSPSPTLLGHLGLSSRT